MGIDTSTNYASDQYPFSFSLEYNPKNLTRRSVSIFDRLSPGQPSNRHNQRPVPRNRQREEPQLGVHNKPVGDNTNLSPRNRQERRAEQLRQKVEQSEPPVEAPDREGGNADEPRRSYDLDDDDANLPFSREIRQALVLNHFMLPKIPKYDERGDPAKYLNGFKTHIGLRGTIPAMKCRALPFDPQWSN